MAFATMHFGVGMACGGAAALGVALIRRKGFQAIGPAMTIGGIWAMVPDLTRLFVWYPSLPFSSYLGGSTNEKRLLSDLFFFHASLDAQPKNYTLLGMALILALYNLVIFAPWALAFVRSPICIQLWKQLLAKFGRERR